MEGYIYCQEDVPKEQWRYGFRSTAATGCGWIATYNALRYLGKQVQPEELIQAYERMFPLVHGNLGTTILAPAFFFKKRGYLVDWTARNDRFDEMVRSSDVCILYYRWYRKWKIGAHFVALHSSNEGIVAYNTYKNSKGPDYYGRSLQEFLEKRKHFGAVLIGIRKRKNHD